MGPALFSFLLFLITVHISQQQLSSEDINTMLDKIIEQTKQNNDTSISIEMNRETYFHNDIAESGNDSDVYYLKAYKVPTYPKDTSNIKILDDILQLTSNISNVSGIVESTINSDTIETEVKEETYDDKNKTLISLFEESDDFLNENKYLDSVDDSNENKFKDAIKDNALGNSDHLNHMSKDTETNIMRKFINDKESDKSFTKIIQEIKDTINADNIIKTTDLDLKPVTSPSLHAMFNKLSDFKQKEISRIAPQNYAPQRAKTLTYNYEPEHDEIIELIEHIMHNKPLGDLFLNKEIENINDDSDLSGTTNIIDKILQEIANNAMTSTITPRLSLPNYLNNFRRSVIYRAQPNFMNPPLVYHKWTPINFPLSPLRYAERKLKPTHFITGVINKLTTRPVLPPMLYTML